MSDLLDLRPADVRAWTCGRCRVTIAPDGPTLEGHAFALVAHFVDVHGDQDAASAPLRILEARQGVSR